MGVGVEVEVIIGVIVVKIRVQMGGVTQILVVIKHKMILSLIFTSYGVLKT